MFYYIATNLQAEGDDEVVGKDVKIMRGSPLVSVWRLLGVNWFRI